MAWESGERVGPTKYRFPPPPQKHREEEGGGGRGKGGPSLISKGKSLQCRLVHCWPPPGVFASSRRCRQKLQTVFFCFFFNSLVWARRSDQEKMRQCCGRHCNLKQLYFHTSLQANKSTDLFSMRSLQNAFQTCTSLLPIRGIFANNFSSRKSECHGLSASSLVLLYTLLLVWKTSWFENISFSYLNVCF